MKINVVTVQSGWILQKIAERICANAPEGVEMTLSHRPVDGGNNFYVDVTNCYHGMPSGSWRGKHVGLFTHVHENDMAQVPNRWFTLDHIIHMSVRSFHLFKSDHRCHGDVDVKMSYKMPGEIPSGFNFQKQTIGIFQRGQYEGKGFNLMKQLAGYDVVGEFRWVFVGDGWGEIIDKLETKTDVLGHSDKINYPQGYRSVYDIVDYVLIPSLWEGGPMSLIEAAALGKKIIAPTGVGWCNTEVPVDYPYQAGNSQHLAMRLEALLGVRDKARKIVEKLSYKDYAQYVTDIFRGIE